MTTDLTNNHRDLNQLLQYRHVEVVEEAAEGMVDPEVRVAILQVHHIA